MRRWRFWKGELLCSWLGHRVNKTAGHPWCARCGLAYEEFILNWYDHYTVKPEIIDDLKGD